MAYRWTKTPLQVLLASTLFGVGCDEAEPQALDKPGADDREAGKADDAATPSTLEFWPELIYPREIISSEITSRVTSWTFLGQEVQTKHFDIALSLEIWGFSQEVAWSRVYNYDRRELYLLFVGKSQFIRDPIHHEFETTIDIEQPASGGEDWHEGWEVFVSVEKNPGCSYHEPDSFRCYDWVSLGEY